MIFSNGIMFIVWFTIAVIQIVSGKLDYALVDAVLAVGAAIMYHAERTKPTSDKRDGA